MSRSHSQQRPCRPCTQRSFSAHPAADEHPFPHGTRGMSEGLDQKAGDQMPWCTRVTHVSWPSSLMRLWVIATIPNVTSPTIGPPTLSCTLCITISPAVGTSEHSSMNLRACVCWASCAVTCPWIERERCIHSVGEPLPSSNPPSRQRHGPCGMLQQQQEDDDRDAVVEKRLARDEHRETIRCAKRIQHGDHRHLRVPERRRHRA